MKEIRTGLGAEGGGGLVFYVMYGVFVLPSFPLPKIIVQIASSGKFSDCWVGHCLGSAVVGANGMCMFVYLYLLSDTLDFSKSTKIRYNAMLSHLGYVYS